MMPSQQFSIGTVEAGLLGTLSSPERLLAVAASGVELQDFAIWGRVYQFQREHHARYGQLPAVEQLRLRFAEFEPVPGEFAFWLTELRKSVLTRQAQALLREGLEAVERDPEELGATVAKLAALRARGNQHSSDSDSSAPVRFEMYERRAAHYAADPDYVLGIRTGFDVINASHIGWCRSEFIGYYARPTTGKTWILVREGANAWAAGHRVVLISPEMSAHQIELREDVFKARAMGVALSHQGIFKGDPAQREAYRVYTDAVQGEKRWWTFDGWNGRPFSVGDVRTVVEQLEPDMVLIDGLSLLRSEQKRDGRARWERMAESCEELKHLATAMDIVIMGSHQSVNTNRGRRGDRDAAGGRGDDWVMPSLSDAADGDALVRNCSSIFTMCPDKELENLRWYSIRKTRERYLKFQPRLALRWQVDEGIIEDLGRHGDNIGVIRQLLGAA